MAKVRSPLADRNRTKSFTGAQVRAALEHQVELAASKRAKVVRHAGEFDARALAAVIKPPFSASPTGGWTIEMILAARDMQMAGRFGRARLLADVMNTNPAIFTARHVRLAPVQSLSVELTAARGPKGDKVADEAEALFGLHGVSVSSETLTTIRSHLTDHGVAFGAVSWSVRDDGSRTDPMLTAWPIEHVYWDEVRGCYMTQVRRFAIDAPTDVLGTTPFEPIVHGNGRWVVFAKSELLPHRDDAALLPAAMVWASHAFASRDWNKGSASHGNPKVIGELSDGTALTDAEGGLTAEAAAFLTLIQGVASQDQPVGIKPAGAKIEYLTNNSRAWEVWDRLIEVQERAAARIYLGTDGVLGAQGGAPGVDISALFGVATSKTQSDLACINRGLQTGLISPWCARNFGDDKLAPIRAYVFPDPDEARVLAGFIERHKAFLEAVEK